MSERTFTKEEMVKLAFTAGGAATAPLMHDHPDYVFPSERVMESVMAVLREEFDIIAHGDGTAEWADETSVRAGVNGEAPREEREDPGQPSGSARPAGATPRDGLRTARLVRVVCYDDIHGDMIEVEIGRGSSGAFDADRETVKSAVGGAIDAYEMKHPDRAWTRVEVFRGAGEGS